MKKFIWIVFLCFSLSSFATGYKVSYKIYVSGNNKPIIETTIMCDNWMTISVDKNRYYLFKKNKGYIVNTKEKKAIEYDFNKNRNFFNSFIAIYGITTNDGSLIFPQLIFKKTKKTGVINKVKARKYQLPGNYLHSNSVAWFAENRLGIDGKVFAKYLSFFTTNSELLKQASQLTSFPLRIKTVLNNGFISDVNLRILYKIEKIKCKKKEYQLPSDYKIIKAKPQGLTAAEM